MNTVVRKIIQSILVLPICLLASVPAFTLIRPIAPSAKEVLWTGSVTLAGLIGVAALVASIFCDPKKETPKLRRLILNGLFIGTGLDLFILYRMATAPKDPFPFDPWQEVFNVWVIVAPIAVAIWNGLPRTKNARATQVPPAAVTTEVTSE